jgi:hypothetical protein
MTSQEKIGPTNFSRDGPTGSRSSSLPTTRARPRLALTMWRTSYADWAPYLKGVPPTHICNYDGSNLKDDPGVEDAFLGGGCKHFKPICNHSKGRFYLF